jgi:DNA polymerase III alpha subunit
MNKTDARVVNVRVFSTLVEAGCMGCWNTSADVLLRDYPEIKKKREKDKKERQKRDKAVEKMGGRSLMDEFQFSPGNNV